MAYWCSNDTSRRSRMSVSTRQKKSPPDRVDQDLADARAAVGRLVGLLCDEERATVEQAAGALEEIGPFAVGPLVAALPEATSTRERAVIVKVLENFAPLAQEPV